jgi:hypothetical protein
MQIEISMDMFSSADRRVDYPDRISDQGGLHLPPKQLFLQRSH